MNDDTDFVKLYRLLGVEPGCTLQVFKQAYRRRVAELHPDRRAGDRERSEGLKDLNLHYAASLAFYRQYGRLPGAAPPAAAHFSTVPLPPERSTPSRSGRPAVQHDPPNRWLLLGLSLAAIIPLCSLLPSSDADEKRTRLAAGHPGDDVYTLIPEALQLGMEAATVATLLDVPLADLNRGEHWAYGPSWIRFDCGQVVDWYSSPLHPLPVTDARPAESDRHRLRMTRQSHRCTNTPAQESTASPAGPAYARRSGTV